jgi:signal peptidase I
MDFTTTPICTPFQPGTSTDSRALSAIGDIPFENIIGRAGMIFFSIGPNATGIDSNFRTERMGMIVR